MNTVFYFQAEDINAIIRTVSAITAFGLCVLSERHKRHNVIYAYLQMFILCMGLWDAFLVGYLIVYDPNIAAFFNSMLYVFSSFACVFFFLFCIKYAYPEKTYPSFFVSIFAVPCITTLLALTYPFQGLLFSYVFVYNPTRILQMYPGVWYYIHLIYSYGICLIGMIFLIRKVKRKNTSDKKTFLPLLILCLCIVAVNILFTLTQNNNFYAVALSGAGHLICILALYLSVRKVNDNYGHKVGDEYIVACCSSLFHNLRKSDLIFRLGGDEFLVLLPRTTAEQTKMLLEKIENNLFLPEGDFPFLRGLSIGCATMNKSDEFSFEKLQHMADVEMYKTKAQRKAGRL